MKLNVNQDLVVSCSSKEAVVHSIRNSLLISKLDFQSNYISKDIAITRTCNIVIHCLEKNTGFSVLLLYSSKGSFVKERKYSCVLRQFKSFEGNIFALEESQLDSITIPTLESRNLLKVGGAYAFSMSHLKDQILVLEKECLIIYSN